MVDLEKARTGLGRLTNVALVGCLLGCSGSSAQAPLATPPSTPAASAAAGVAGSPSDVTPSPSIAGLCAQVSTDFVISVVSLPAGSTKECHPQPGAGDLEEVDWSPPVTGQAAVAGGVQIAVIDETDPHVPYATVSPGVVNGYGTFEEWNARRPAPRPLTISAGGRRYLAAVERGELRVQLERNRFLMVSLPNYPADSTGPLRSLAERALPAVPR